MKTTKTENVVIADEAHPFKGYTIEEIRYQRAMMSLRKEFCKAKLMESIQNLRGGSPKNVFSGKKESTGGKMAIAGKIVSKIFSNLNTFDYILMGISLFGTAKKGIKLLKGKK